MNFLESEHCTTVLIVILSIIVFVWFIYPMMCGSSSHENFAAVPAPANNTPVDGKTQAVIHAPVDQTVKVPYYDAERHFVMSGTEFLQPKFDDDDAPPITIIPPNSYLLDDGNEGKTGLHSSRCSKSCCSQQYPIPFNLSYQQDVCGAETEFVPNNLMCNNAWNDSGCLCLTKDQANNLADRGGNA